MDSKITEARRRQGDQIERGQMQANLERDYGKRPGAVSMSDTHWSQMMLPRERIEQLENVNVELGQELTRLKSEVERLRGRCGELESALRPFAAEAEYIPDDAVDIHLNYMMDGAEVLERAEFTAEHIHTAAQRLRQQADEAEKAY